MNRRQTNTSRRWWFHMIRNWYCHMLISLSILKRTIQNPMNRLCALKTDEGRPRTMSLLKIPMKLARIVWEMWVEAMQEFKPTVNLSVIVWVGFYEDRNFLTFVFIQCGFHRDLCFLVRNYISHSRCFGQCQSDSRYCDWLSDCPTRYRSLQVKSTPPPSNSIWSN